MTTLLAIVGFAALFVAFGVLRPSRRKCGSDCSCEGGTCELEEPGHPSEGPIV